VIEDDSHRRAQVAEARKLLGWTRAKIAAELGISVSQIASFELGNAELTVLQTSVLRRSLERAGVRFDARDSVQLERLPAE
jgi:transcriptional regulator with XRE-family HTH domain